MVKCEECDTQLIEAKDLADTSRDAYLSDISKGGLTIPSREFSDFVSKVYAFLDFFDQYMGISVRHRSLVALEKYSPDSAMGCESHTARNRNFVFKIITNTFFNNKQNQAADNVRENGIKYSKQRQ